MGPNFLFRPFMSSATIFVPELPNGSTGPQLTGRPSARCSTRSPVPTSRRPRQVFEAVLCRPEEKRRRLKFFPPRQEFRFFVVIN